MPDPSPDEQRVYQRLHHRLALEAHPLGAYSREAWDSAPARMHRLNLALIDRCIAPPAPAPPGPRA